MWSPDQTSPRLHIYMEEGSQFQLLQGLPTLKGGEDTTSTVESKTLSTVGGLLGEVSTDLEPVFDTRYSV